MHYFIGLALHNFIILHFLKLRVLLMVLAFTGTFAQLLVRIHGENPNIVCFIAVGLKEKKLGTDLPGKEEQQTKLLTLC